MANNGQPNEAIHVLIDWVFFSRQILDRELFIEVLWAANSMCRGLERIRDVAYVDFRGSEHNLAPDQITGALRDAVTLSPTGRQEMRRVCLAQNAFEMDLWQRAVSRFLGGLGGLA